MRTSGFTFVRDGVRLGYPFEAALRSLLPLCDELVVNVGVSSDETLDRVRALDDGRLVIFESRWDESLRQGGRILAQQTDLALARCRGDWCIYLQADEVLHEDDAAAIRAAMAVADRRPDVDGLLFRYLHFYGSFHTVGISRRWYRHEVRAFKNGRGVSSWRDAQGFRRVEAAAADRPRKLRVVDSGARVFHYGWVRPPTKMLEKTRRFERLYRGDAEVERALTDHVDGAAYRYEVDEKVRPFAGTHPAAMAPWIASADWPFEPRRRWLRRGHLREDLLDLAEAVTGHRFFEYRNYLRAG
ncbi:MAG: glycosyltransferase family 2 protein [Deltaproteobacteria bacterium]|nr:glycosyltransferase family 2 protein [Deltaproteobacteria bacterium]